MYADDLLFGNRRIFRYILRIAVITTVVASLFIVVRLDTVFPLLRWVLWVWLIGVATGLAGYAGKNHGGILSGWIALFLAVNWLYIVPPLVAYLQGDEFGDRSYAVLRPSVIGLNPYAELMTGLQIGPVVAILVALTVGSTAFILGKGLQRPSEGASNASTNK